MVRWTEKQLQATQLKHVVSGGGTMLPEPRKQSKYRAEPTIVDGIRFQSKREANYYRDLKLRIASGEIIMILRQTPLHLTGGVKLVLDFVEFHADGSVHWTDVKGFQTPAFKIKRKQAEELYPIKIEMK